MICARKVTDHESPPFATQADFCEVFQKDINRLFLLSFLLTGNQSLAEECFMRALEESTSGNPVPAERAESWAPRMIIRNAIQIIRPRPAGNGGSNSMSEHNTEHSPEGPAELTRIFEIPSFERFAFVMSMLERYSDRESSLLLDCTVSELVAARIRALQQIAESAERTR